MLKAEIVIFFGTLDLKFEHGFILIGAVLNTCISEGMLLYGVLHECTHKHISFYLGLCTCVGSSERRFLLVWQSRVYVKSVIISKV